MTPNIEGDCTLDALAFRLSVVVRPPKPRDVGVTMVIDKGLGEAAARDLVTTAGAWVDIVKLTSATSLLSVKGSLEHKISIYREAEIDVGLGGTLAEAAIHRGLFEELLRAAARSGCNIIEISDGTISLSRSARNDAIARAQGQGFKVVTEVGRKEWSAEADIDHIVRDVEADAAAGASHIIVEAMEFGKGVGVFDADGLPREDAVRLIGSAADRSKLLWEAPLRQQQEYFIDHFGATVNLGNIPPGEVLVLEATRRALTGVPFKEEVMKTARHGVESPR